MQGIVVFKSLGEAQNYGFQVFDRTKDGFLVRKLTPNGYALAIVRDEQRTHDAA